MLMASSVSFSWDAGLKPASLRHCAIVWRLVSCLPLTVDYCKKQLDFMAVNTEIILIIVKNGRLIGEETKIF
jgi:hypothetical protein